VPLPEGTCALPHLGVIEATGKDAASFLHNQFTQDILLLPPTEARLGAFCNAKGRMQASFILAKPEAERVLLVLARELIAQTVKRLGLFVLRAQVKLRDASADYELRGLLGGAFARAHPDAQAGTRLSYAGGEAWVLSPVATHPRALWLAALGTAAPADDALPEAAWQVAEVFSGVAWVTSPIFEAFVPQMLNYESVGGVNFRKGCYPGQEVVARSQFRGSLKRRAALFETPMPLAVGAELGAPGEPERIVGQVAAAASWQDRHWVLAVMVDGATQAQGLGAPCPLPYAIRDDL
jgi:folate-binding protein YgfZ